MIGALEDYADWAAWLSPGRLWLNGWFVGPDLEKLVVGLGDGVTIRRYEAAVFSSQAGADPRFRQRTLLLDVESSWHHESEIRGITLELPRGTVAWHGAARLLIEGDLGAATTHLSCLPAATLLDLLGFVARHLAATGGTSELARRNMRLLTALIVHAVLPSAASDTHGGWAAAVDESRHCGPLGLTRGWVLEPPSREVGFLVVQPSGDVVALRSAAATYHRPDLDEFAIRWRGTAAGFLVAFPAPTASEETVGEPLLAVSSHGHTAWLRSPGVVECSLAECRHLIDEVLDGPGGDEAGAGSVVRELAAALGRPAVVLDVAYHDGRRHGSSPPELLVAMPVDDPMRAEIQLAELARGGALDGAVVVWLVSRGCWTGAIRRRFLGLAALYGIRLRVLVVADETGWGARMNASRTECDAELLAFLGGWALPAATTWWDDLRAPFAAATTGVVGVATLFEGDLARDAGASLGTEVAAMLAPRATHRPVALPVPRSAGPVAAVPPGCVCVRADCFEDWGGFDGSYFTERAELIDLCLRARASGSEVVLSAATFYDLSPTEAPRTTLERLAQHADQERLQRRREMATVARLGDLELLGTVGCRRS